MSYTKQTWQTGDTITAEKLNHIEDGVDDLSRQLGDKAPLVVNEVSGDIAIFDNAVPDTQIVKIIADFTATKVGSGTPSPSNKWTITGWDNCTIYHSGDDTSNPESSTFQTGSAGTMYGGYAELDANGDVDIKKTIVKLDSSALSTLGWSKYNPKTGTLGYYHDFQSGYYNPQGNHFSNALLLDTTGSSSDAYKMRFASASRFWVFVPTTVDTVAKFKSFLTSNSIDIYLELASPANYPKIVGVGSFVTLDGINKVWCTTGSIESVAYDVDTKAYVDEASQRQEAYVSEYYQESRTNKQTPERVQTYLDVVDTYCYCAPNNLTNAKIIIYHSPGGSVDAGAACFVDFAANTAGFYEPFASFTPSTAVRETVNVPFAFNASHEYCIAYKRHSTSPIYTLTITDLMTLDSVSYNDTISASGWGTIWFTATNINVRSFASYAGNPINPTVLFVGDSYVEGMSLDVNGSDDRDKRWCYLLGNDIGSYAINGQGGAKASNILTWLSNYLLDVYNPAYIVIVTGQNETDVSEYMSNMDSIISLLKTRNIIPILSTVAVTSAKTDPSGYNDYVVNSGLPYIDIARALTVDGDRVTQNTSYFMSDLIHPTIQGHQRIFDMAKINLPWIFRLYQ